MRLGDVELPERVRHLLVRLPDLLGERPPLLREAAVGADVRGPGDATARDARPDDLVAAGQLEGLGQRGVHREAHLEIGRRDRRPVVQGERGADRADALRRQRLGEVGERAVHQGGHVVHREVVLDHDGRRDLGSLRDPAGGGGLGGVVRGGHRRHRDSSCSRSAAGRAGWRRPGQTLSRQAGRHQHRRGPATSGAARRHRSRAPVALRPGPPRSGLRSAPSLPRACRHDPSPHRPDPAPARRTSSSTRRTTPA